MCGLSSTSLKGRLAQTRLTTSPVPEFAHSPNDEANNRPADTMSAGETEYQRALAETGLDERITWR